MMTTLTYLFLVGGGIAAAFYLKPTLISRYYIAVVIPGLSMFLFKQKIRGVFSLAFQAYASFLCLIQIKADIFYLLLVMHLFIIQAVMTVYKDAKKTRQQEEEGKSRVQWQQDN